MGETVCAHARAMRNARLDAGLYVRCARQRVVARCYGYDTDRPDVSLFAPSVAQTRRRIRVARARAGLQTMLVLLCDMRICCIPDTGYTRTRRIWITRRYRIPVGAAQDNVIGYVRKLHRIDRIIRIRRIWIAVCRIASRKRCASARAVMYVCCCMRQLHDVDCYATMTTLCQRRTECSALASRVCLRMRALTVDGYAYASLCCVWIYVVGYGLLNLQPDMR